MNVKQKKKSEPRIKLNYSIHVVEHLFILIQSK